LKIPIAVHYRLSIDKFSPVFAMRINNLIVLSQNEEFKYYYFIEEHGKSIPTYQLGVIVKAGIDYPMQNHHSLFIEINWKYSQSLNVTRRYRLTNKLFALKAGYAF